MGDNYISLKAVVDKTINRVVYVESDEKLVDILFSFLTMPMGTIVRLTRNRQTTRSCIGGLNNLYHSVETLDERYLRTEACQTMLLYPRNGAAAQCENLKLAIENGAPLQYFLCERSCAVSDYKLLSHYENAICGCGKRLRWQGELKGRKTTGVAFDDQDEGVFVKGPIQLTISEELQVMPSSTDASLSLFSKLGIDETSSIEERTILMGKVKAIKLLKCLLLSRKPLTEAHLHSNVELGLNSMEDAEHVSFRKIEIEEAASNNDEKIYVKLVVSKSKNMVCYAEASEKFADLLFSFLTVPLGFIAKEMQEHGSKNRCINNLYESTQDLDARQHLASRETTAMLVSPKLAPGFSYDGQPLNIEEYMHPPYYYSYYLSGWDTTATLTSDETLRPRDTIANCSVLTVTDPKSNYNDNSSGKGFLKGPAMFTITDDLIITPLSSVTGLSALKKLKVSLSDIEEQIVYVGKEEASRLLVSSLVTESVLTNAFLAK